MDELSALQQHLANRVIYEAMKADMQPPVLQKSTQKRGLVIMQTTFIYPAHK